MYRLLAGLSLLTFTGCVGTAGTGKDTSPPNDESGTTLPCDEDGDGYCESEGDCNEGDASINPGATEICDGLDNNCDSAIDEEVTATFYADADGDGFGDANVSDEGCEAQSGYVDNSLDCNDANNLIFPQATEVCDGMDNNCDGNIDEGVTSLYYADSDGDTYGDPLVSQEGCEAPAGYITDNADCDDSKASAFPGNMEVCDEVDNDCNGLTDEGVQNTYYADTDGDSFGTSNLTQKACSAPRGYVADSTDCDDSNGLVNPAATEICNAIDDNCDGQIDENTAADATTWYQDSDQDGYGNAAVSQVSCTAPRDYVTDSTDCDDSRAATNPGATERCNGIDDNCDSRVDEDTAVDASTWYIDVDGDGYGNANNSRVSCDQPNGYVADYTDCNDGSSLAYPGATEYCDTLDNNCDGRIDEDSAVDADTWYQDFDGDNYGNASIVTVSCSQPAGYILNSGDCDDNRAASYPGAPEYCNGYDDDCDGTIDEDASIDVSTWYQDADGDGFGNRLVTDIDCNQPAGWVSDNTDCDDAVATTYPGAAETCNGVDDDCDGSVDETGANGSITWYRDADSDGYGDAGVTQVSCDQPVGYVGDGTDCDDLQNDVYPGAAEYCDGDDNDCNGTVDDNPVDGNTYYADNDGDGMGDANSTISECALPSGYSENDYDCNDSNGAEPVVADSVNGSNAGSGTWADPYFSLQDAIDDAYACVVALRGTYAEAIDLGGKSIDIWGVDGSDYTTIDPNATVCTYANPNDCEAAVTIASGNSASSHLHGFTIAGGSGHVTSSSTNTTCADSSASHAGSNTCTVTIFEYYGGGLYINGDDPELSDIVVRDNTLPEFTQVSMGSYTQYWLYSYGGGIAILNSATDLTGISVTGNYADQGGGIYVSDGAVTSIEQSKITDNSATDGAGVEVSTGTAYLTNTALYCNTADTDGGGLFTEVSGLAYLVNTVFYQNDAAAGTTHGADAYVGASTGFYLYNSIVEARSGAVALYGVGSGSIEYSNVRNDGTGGIYGGSLSGGVGTISSGNNFTSVTCDGNPLNDDFTLRSGSASINAGNPNVSYNDVDGTRNDMGAHGGPGGNW